LTEIVGQARQPRLIVSSHIGSPAALGVLRPTIVLPASFAELEPDEHVEAALRHEWSHIQNGDLRALAVARLLLPLLFAHPLYAWLKRRMAADQEALADASAAAGAGQVAYAETLLGWAKARRETVLSVPAPSLGLWERSSSLSARVALLLDRRFKLEPVCPLFWRRLSRSLTLAMLLGLGLGLVSGPSGTAGSPRQPTPQAVPPGQESLGKVNRFLCPDETISQLNVRCCNSSKSD
jgi:hypothetical protein